MFKSMLYCLFVLAILAAVSWRDNSVKFNATTAKAATTSSEQPVLEMASGTSYVKISCYQAWRNWTPLCCNAFQTMSACEQSYPAGKPCIVVDLDEMREKTKNSRAAPAC